MSSEVEMEEKVKSGKVRFYSNYIIERDGELYEPTCKIRKVGYLESIDRDDVDLMFEEYGYKRVCEIVNGEMAYWKCKRADNYGLRDE